MKKKQLLKLVTPAKAGIHFFDFMDPRMREDDVKIGIV